MEELNEGLGDMLVANWEKHMYDFAHSVSGLSTFFDGVWRLGSTWCSGSWKKHIPQAKTSRVKSCEEKIEGDL